MSTFNIDMTTNEIVAEFYIEGTTGGPAVGNISTLNLDGSDNHVLYGNGVWANISGGSGTANVAGANGQLQYNSNGNLGAITGVTSDGVKLSVNGIANLHVTGGSNGQVVMTDGSGNLSFQTLPGFIQLGRVDVSSPIGAITSRPSWTDPTFAYYGNDPAKMNIFVNGVLSDPSLWELSGSTLTYKLDLLSDTSVEILPQVVLTGNTDLSGNINALNITANSVTANAFIGDGSGLTNLNAGTRISNLTTSVSTIDTGRVDVVVDNADMLSIDQNGMELAGDFLPAANIVYDLGSPTRRWKDLYLSNNTIVLGDTSLSADANGLSIGGETALTAPGGVLTVDTLTANHLSGNGASISNIEAANVVGQVANAYQAYTAEQAMVAYSVEYENISNIGNISATNFDGNISNVLHGDGSWLAQVVVGNIAPLNLNGNVATVLAGDGTWVAKADDANFANFAGEANVAGVANSIALANVVGVGNIASLNLDGNTSNVLSGAGTFINNKQAGGNSTEIQFNTGGVLTTTPRFFYNGNSVYNFSENTDTTIPSIAFVGVTCSDNAVPGGYMVAKTRGTYSTPLPLANADFIGTFIARAYTGNGNYAIGGMTGFSSVAPAITAQVIGLPSADTLPPSTRWNFQTTSNTVASARTMMTVEYSNVTIAGGSANSNVFIAGNSANSNVFIAGNSANSNVFIAPSTSSNVTIIMGTGTGSKLILGFTTVPATATSTGTTGQIAFDSNYIYYCVATNTWKRSALATW